MLQRILAERPRAVRLKKVDLPALTPLIYSHVNPYGIFRLDLNIAIPIDTGSGNMNADLQQIRRVT
jgi:hypothetical protein